MAKKRTTSESRKRMMAGSHQRKFDRKLRNQMLNDDRAAANRNRILSYISATGDTSILKTKTTRRKFLDAVIWDERVQATA